jgi:hypothetical protein
MQESDSDDSCEEHAGNGRRLHEDGGGGGGGEESGAVLRWKDVQCQVVRLLLALVSSCIYVTDG